MFGQPVDRSIGRPAWVSVRSVVEIMFNKPFGTIVVMYVRQSTVLTDTATICSVRRFRHANRPVSRSVWRSSFRPSIRAPIGRTVRRDFMSSIGLFPSAVGPVRPSSGLTARRSVLRAVERCIGMCLGSVDRRIDRSEIRLVGRFCWSALAPGFSYMRRNGRAQCHAEGLFAWAGM